MSSVNTDLVQCNTGSWLSRAGCRAPSSPCSMRMLSKQKGLCVVGSGNSLPGARPVLSWNRSVMAPRLCLLRGGARTGDHAVASSSQHVLIILAAIRNAEGRLLRGTSVASHQDEHLFSPLYMHTIILSALSLSH